MVCAVRPSQGMIIRSSKCADYPRKFEFSRNQGQKCWWRQAHPRNELCCHTRISEGFGALNKWLEHSAGHYRTWFEAFDAQNTTASSYLDEIVKRNPGKEPYSVQIHPPREDGVGEGSRYQGCVSLDLKSFWNFVMFPCLSKPTNPTGNSIHFAETTHKTLIVGKEDHFLSWFGSHSNLFWA